MKEKIKNTLMAVIGGESKNRNIFLAGMGIIILLGVISYFVGK